MPLIEYRMNSLRMGTFTCVYMGTGGILMGGCAISGFAIGVVIPRRCFKFSIGDKAYFKSGKPVFIVKIRNENGINFYQVEANGDLTYVPESGLFTLSEILDCQDSSISNIESKIEGILSCPAIPLPVRGKGKIPSKNKGHVPATEMLADKIFMQLKKIADLPPAENPSIGKIFILDELGNPKFDLSDLGAEVEQEIDSLQDCIDNLPLAVDPPTGKALVIDETDNDLDGLLNFGTEIEQEIYSLQDCIDNLPPAVDPPTGKALILNDSDNLINDLSNLGIEVEQEIDSLQDCIENLPIAPLIEEGLACGELDNSECDALLDVENKIEEKIDSLQDCIDSLPPPIGEIIFPEQSVYIIEMTGGIKMGGCAFIRPPDGTCPCE